MNGLYKYRFCFIAGLCAAGGSFFGKLPSLFKEGNLYTRTKEIHELTATMQIYGAFILYQCLPMVFMIVSNLLNWRYFLKALQLTEQTLIATVLTAASNYMVSFILGSLVFKEPVTWLSAFGSTFIILGLWFLCEDKQNNTEKVKLG